MHCCHIAAITNIYMEKSKNDSLLEIPDIWT